MKRGVVRGALLAACLGGCAAASHGAAPDQGAALAPRPPPAPPRDVEPAALLGLATDEADVLLRLSVARTHPLGPKLEPFVLAWPGWGSTLRRFTVHPVAELDWIDIVGPRGSGEGAPGRAHDHGRRARGLAPGQRRGRIAARDAAAAVAPRHRGPARRRRGADDGAAGRARGRSAAAGADEGLRAVLPHPHQFFRVFPEEALSGLLRVLARPAGAAEAELALSCGDPRRPRRSPRRCASRPSTSTACSSACSRTICCRACRSASRATRRSSTLPASREQLEALAALAAGFIPPQPAP